MKKHLVPLACILVGLAPAMVFAAPCTVPNTIANGQVADASKVMDNFNAVAACADQGVKTTGTPTPGSIATFSGPGSIATGNLTGDVTTAGGTAATLSNSGVVAGTYSNPNIIVDAKGRITSASQGNGGGGSGWWFQPPSAASFTLGSGSTTFLTLADDTDVGLRIAGGNPTTGDVNRIAYRTLINKNTSWDIKVRIDLTIPVINYSGAGIMLRDSVTGKITSFTVRGDYYLAVANWSGYTGLSSAPTLMKTVYQNNWFRVYFDGTNYNFYISPDGKQWVLISAVPSTSWLNNRADQVGLTVDYNISQ